MKAFLLAAGEGRRLRPLTETVPKCLVPIRGVPLLAIWLELLERHGVSDVLINLHHLHERVLEFLGGHETSLRVHTVYEERLAGSAGTVLANRNFVEGEEQFLVLYADNLTNADLGGILRFHARRRERLTLGVVVTDRPREKGIVVFGSDGVVTDFEEKPSRPRSRYVNAGIYAAGPELFDALPPAGAGGGGPLDFGFHVLARLLPRVDAYVIRDYLVDVGTKAAYDRAQKDWPGL